VIVVVGSTSLTPGVIELLIAASERELATVTNHRFVREPAALRANDYHAMNQTLFDFLDKLMDHYASSHTVGRLQGPHR
jgi:GMP synthase (glutamine-hydrolysing)